MSKSCNKLNQRWDIVHNKFRRSMPIKLNSFNCSRCMTTINWHREDKSNFLLINGCYIPFTSKTKHTCLILPHGMGRDKKYVKDPRTPWVDKMAELDPSGRPKVWFAATLLLTLTNTYCLSRSSQFNQNPWPHFLFDCINFITNRG